MATIESLVRTINRELVPMFEERLRADLAGRDREWLVDQVVRLTLDAHSLQEMDRRSIVEAKARARRERLDRVRTLGLDRAGLEAFLAAHDFMKASTELSAAGTWQDPDSVSNDERADNILLEVQFGEIGGELVGRGIVTTLSLINNLEVNEQVLYARMINIEEATLIA